MALALADAETEQVEQSAQVEQTDPSILTLEAGENLVGWVDAPQSVEALLRQVPAIASVRAWDPLLQAFYEPDTLRPGEGFIFVLPEGERARWQRPLTPVKSRVTLRRGRNLVAWLGPDDWTIERVTQGIGAALVQAEWQAARYVPGAGPRLASQPTLKRGDALWLELSRTVSWLQPAGVMPTLRFTGEVSAELQAVVERDALDVMNYFAAEFGVQVDGSLLTVYVASDLTSLIGALEQDGRGTNVHLTWYRSGGWANPSGYIVVKLAHWQSQEAELNRSDTVDPHYTYGRYVMAHELFHAVQYQTKGGTAAASWLVEGTADWVEARLRQRDHASAMDTELAGQRRSALKRTAPPLDHTELNTEGWHYTLGALASDQLVQRSGPDALLEFWRALRPQALGPLGRWRSTPPWQSVFADVFGLTLDDFYQRFASWRSTLAPITFRGRVIGPDGEGLPYVEVTTRSKQLENSHTSYSHVESLYTDADGSFLLTSAAVGELILGVNLDDACTMYYSARGMVAELGQADALSTVHVNGEHPQALRLQITDQMCVWRVSGRLLDAGGKAIADVWVGAHSDGAYESSKTDAEGVFSITLPIAGEYRLSTSIDGCSVYYRAGSATGKYNAAEMLKLAGADITGLRFQLASGICELRIAGRVLDANGSPVADVWVSATGDGDAGSGGGRTDSDGSFTFTVSSAGEYRLRVSIDGCGVYYRAGSATGKRDAAEMLKLTGADITGLRFQLASGMCELRIAGRVLEANGSRVAGIWVNANSDAGYGGGRIDSDGSFTLTVPSAGLYRLHISIDGCDVYYRAGSATGKRDAAEMLKLTGADITGLRFQLASGMCELRIAGRVLEANGSPVAGVWVYANGDAGYGSGQTDSDGSFTLTVPSAGLYRLYTWLSASDCIVYLGVRGPVRSSGSALLLRVSNRDVAEIEFRLPDNPSTFCS